MSPIPTLAICCAMFILIIAGRIFLHARKLRRESERRQSPDHSADVLGVGAADFILDHREPN